MFQQVAYLGLCILLMLWRSGLKYVHYICMTTYTCVCSEEEEGEEEKSVSHPKSVSNFIN